MWVPMVGTPRVRALGMYGAKRRRGPGELDTGVAGPWQLSVPLVSSLAQGASSYKAPIGISLWESPGCDVGLRVT